MTTEDAVKRSRLPKVRFRLHVDAEDTTQACIIRERLNRRTGRYACEWHTALFGFDECARVLKNAYAARHIPREFETQFLSQELFLWGAIHGIETKLAEMRRGECRPVVFSVIPCRNEHGTVQAFVCPVLTMERVPVFMMSRGVLSCVAQA
jgi:hypothetical protein